MRILIIGGGAGGASVAARARRLNEHADILLVDKRSDISQATCGLPYYIGNTIKDRSRLLVVSKEEFANLLQVDVRTLTEVVEISRSERTVTLIDHSTGHEYRESYDKLVLAPGSIPRVPDVSGVHRPNVFTLQSIDDMDTIKKYLESRECRNAVIVGGGFIGLEMADNLHQLGLKVTIVESSPQLIGSIDSDLVSLVHQHLQQQGVELRLNDSVVAVSKNAVVLASEDLLPSDIVILAMGMRPANQLALKSGLELGDRDGILVNPDMTTSDPDIYALGDSVEIENTRTKERAMLQLAGPTQKQAAVVADNIFGAGREYRPGAGTTIAKVFDLTIAATGSNESKLAERGASYQKAHVDVPSHASYYPNATPLTIKLLFEPESGVVLGAQVVGFDGVDKRIDVLASAVQFGRTVFELADLDLAYAPPYSSAKDPVNVAGMVARNMIEQDYRVMYWEEFIGADRQDCLVLDVRTREERELDFVQGSIHIPLEELRDRADEIPRGKHIAIYCQLGKKGYFAFRILRQMGFDDLSNLSGGFKLLQSATTKTSANQESQVSFPVKTVGELDTASISMEIDATGLSCPGPIMRLTQGIKRINDGELLLITASDPAFGRDVETWCKKTGNMVYSSEKKQAITRLIIKKN